jgi:peptide chain release factor subunit 1
MKPMIETEVEDDDKHIQMWKIKRLIKNLDNQQGNGSSMVSLIIPPKEQLSKMNELLTKEYGTAQNIKSSKTKQTVSTAIVSTKEKLKLYRKTPDNGLVIFCGQVLLDDGKTEKKITIDFEPFRPINQFLYKCDTKFHTGPLQGLLQDSDTFGFIIVDGNGVVYATLQGNNREIKQKIQVDLPQKHNKGGQSSVRFARIAEEKRGVYLKKVAELATANFITNDMPNVKGLILAGSADFKYKLNDSQDFDPRLKKVVIKVIDVAYGGENGLSQAIQLASDALANVKFVAEKRLI